MVEITKEQCKELNRLGYNRSFMFTIDGIFLEDIPSKEDLKIKIKYHEAKSKFHRRMISSLEEELKDYRPIEKLIDQLQKFHGK